MTTAGTHSRVFASRPPGESKVLVNTARLGEYEQEAEQIRPGHKLLNGEFVRSLDLNSPINENW